MHAIVQSSGAEIQPGDWIHITFKDGDQYVGRFSGVYEHPSWGLMFRLAFARPPDGSKPSDMVCCFLKEGNGCAEALDNAIPIEKPTKRKGALVIKPRRPDGASLH